MPPSEPASDAASGPPLHPPAGRPTDWLLLCRTVRFGDTDAAGVMHFHQLLRWSHEAYEESLKRYGIPAAEVFPRPGSIPAVALPIVHCEADYLRPLACGDPLAIALRPRQRNESSFEVTYRFYSDGTETARALSRHQAIDPVTRRATELPSAILRWLEASIPAVGGLAL